MGKDGFLFGILVGSLATCALAIGILFMLNGVHAPQVACTTAECVDALKECDLVARWQRDRIESLSNALDHGPPPEDRRPTTETERSHRR